MQFQETDFQVSFSNESGKSSALAQAESLFKTHGCFLAKGLIPVSQLLAIRRDIHQLVKIRQKIQGLSQSLVSQQEDTLDQDFLTLSRLDRKEGSIIYDACRRLLPVHGLSCSPILTTLSQQLMKTDTLIACNLKALRIDYPHEDKYLFDWHQDYPYIQDSEDGLVYWIPLQDMDESLGQLVIAPGSHQLGILMVRLEDPENRNQNGAHTIVLAEPQIVDQFPQISLKVKIGDALVFSSLLLHRSGLNRSHKVRWTVQIRHGNFKHPAAIARQWPGGMFEGVRFESRHPEYVLS